MTRQRKSKNRHVVGRGKPHSRSQSRVDRVKAREANKLAARFAAERDAALLSMDKQQIAAFWLDWNIAMPTAVLDSEPLFLVTVHKMRVQIKSLPLAERRASKQWLEAHGFKVKEKDL